MASAPSASAIRALSLEYKGLSEDPVEGFRVKLLNEEDMFVWEVALFGPPDTLYQGGYFKVIISFVKYMIIVISNNSFLWCCVAWVSPRLASVLTRAMPTLEEWTLIQFTRLWLVRNHLSYDLIGWKLNYCSSLLQWAHYNVLDCTQPECDLRVYRNNQHRVTYLDMNWTDVVGTDVSENRREYCYNVSCFSPRPSSFNFVRCICLSVSLAMMNFSDFLYKGSLYLKLY